MYFCGESGSFFDILVSFTCLLSVVDCLLDEEEYHIAEYLMFFYNTHYLLYVPPFATVSSSVTPNTP